jgi:hypothetical protein
MASGEDAFASQSPARGLYDARDVVIGVCHISRAIGQAAVEATTTGMVWTVYSIGPME